MTNFRYTLVSTRWLFAAVTLVFGMMVFATPAHAIVVASIDITDVDVDNGPSTVVEPSDSVEVDVTVTTVGTGEGNDWESTSYEILIDGQPGMQCVNTTDHLFAGVYTETFNITAPADPGTYDLQIKIYRDSDNCTGFNDTQTFADVIVVAEPTPILGCMDDAATNYNPDATVNDESCVYPKATIVATKLVCTDETDLPNWGAAGGPNITSTTASDWLVEHESCSLQSGWNFQWVLDSVKADPGDTMTGEAGDPWVTFGPTNGSGVASAELFAADLGEESKIWLREVLQDGYIPFTHDATANEDDYSAEFYCHTDVINYDNYDWISGIELESTYYCVAWNVGIPVPTYPLDGYKWGDTDGDGYWDEGENGLSGWTIQVTDGEVTHEDVTDENGYYSFDLPQGEWTVSEVQQGGWAQTAPIESGTCTFTLGNLLKTLVVYDQVGMCNFGNQQVPEGALSCSFTSDDYTVSKGQDFTLTWDTNGADSVTITGLEGEIALDGSQVTSLTSDSTFILTASRLGEEQTTESITCEVGIDVKSSGGGSRRNNDNDDEGGEVLGESTTRLPDPEVLGEAIAPAGAPNTGAGGAATGSFASIFALLGMLASFATIRATKNS